jgi:hypothetical protein
MIEESGAGAGSIPLRRGSGYRRLKNIWIRRIRIRNTAFNTLNDTGEEDFESGKKGSCTAYVG